MCFREEVTTITEKEWDLARMFLQTRTVRELLYLYPDARMPGRSFIRADLEEAILRCYLPEEVQKQYIWAIIAGNGRLP